MKTLQTWVVAVTVGSFAMVAGEASANLLTNGGFETPDASGGDVPGATGWSQFNDAFTTVSVTPHGGDQVLKIFGPFFNGGGAGVVQGGFAASEGQMWSASAWLRNDSSEPIGTNNFAVVKVEFLDAGSAVIGAFESAQFNGSATPDLWTFHEAQGVAPAGAATAQIVLVHVQLDPITGGSVFFDDASLAIIPEPASLALLGVGGLMALRRHRR